MQELMDATKSYAKYRESIGQNSGFAIPYLYSPLSSLLLSLMSLIFIKRGVHLRDLIYFDDSMKNEQGQINLKALVGVNAILAQFSEFQNSSITFETNPKLVQYLAYLFFSLFY